MEGVLADVADVDHDKPAARTQYSQHFIEGLGSPCGVRQVVDSQRADHHVKTIVRVGHGGHVARVEDDPGGHPLRRRIGLSRLQTVATLILGSPQVQPVSLAVGQPTRRRQQDGAVATAHVEQILVTPKRQVVQQRSPRHVLPAQGCVQVDRRLGEERHGDHDRPGGHDPGDHCDGERAACHHHEERDVGSIDAVAEPSGSRSVLSHCFERTATAADRPARVGCRRSSTFAAIDPPPAYQPGDWPRGPDRPAAFDCHWSWVWSDREQDRDLGGLRRAGGPMTADVQSCAYGRPASLRLAATIQAAQGTDPLAPVTVVVPSNFTGLALRRLLGTGIIGGTGLANVQFLTPLQLAQILSEDLDLGRRHLSSAVVGAAVRLALADDPGPFAHVSDHPVTESALVATFTELSLVDSSGLERLSRDGGTYGAQLVKLHHRIASYLTDFRTETEVACSAAERPDLDAAVEPLGHLVWFAPAPLARPLARLLGAVLELAPSTVIVCLTGDAQSDAPTLATCRAAGLAAPAPDGPPPSPPTAEHVLSATDPDDEVRAVIRRLVSLAHAGVRLDRVAVLYPTPDPYRSILEQQLAAAELPANGPSGARLADSVPGRTLLAALALPSRGYPRDLVLALASGAPVRYGTGWARPAAWESLSRQAGVVGGLADWRSKLGHYVAVLGARRDQADEATTRRIDRDVEALGALTGFVEHLAQQLEATRSATTWSAKTTHARNLLSGLLGTSGQRESWPTGEAEAFDRVDDALTRLAGLDEIEPLPGHDVFVRALTSELDVARGRNGRYGEGVQYGPLAAAAGLDLDAVFILGANEGVLPRPRRDEAMIPNRLRELTDGQLPVLSTALADQHRALLAALAAAPASGRYLSRPRGELRSSHRTIASRWLVDSVRALSGTEVTASKVDDLATSGTPGLVLVPSHRAGVLHDDVPVSDVERELRVAQAVIEAGGDLQTHWVAERVSRGLLAQTARRSSAFTEWDGNLAGEHIPLRDGAISASRLESWASCGFRYLLSYELGLGARDDPEAIVSIGALDRGSALHKILERFVAGGTKRAGGPTPDQPWSDERRAELYRLADEVFEELARSGRTGRNLFWRQTRRDLEQTLDQFLTDDDEWRRGLGLTPIEVEWTFGMGEAPALTIDLDDGRTLAFRGSIDRIDETAAGTLEISDYKTGSAKKPLALVKEDADPVLGGTLLQLGIYAEAAHQHLAADSDAPSASYWRLEAKEGKRHLGYSWTPARRGRLVEVLTAIVDGIGDGAFPLVPGPYDSWRRTHENCTYCDFNTLCPSDRGEQTEIKAVAIGATPRRVLQVERPEGDPSA